MKVVRAMALGGTVGYLIGIPILHLSRGPEMAFLFVAPMLLNLLILWKTHHIIRSERSEEGGED